MDNKIKSDADLKNHLTVFFSAVEGARCKTNEESVKGMTDLFSGTKPNRMVDGYVFEVDPCLTENQFKVIRRCVQLLGSSKGHEEEISTILWKAAVSHVSYCPSDINKSVSDFLSVVSSLSSQPKRYLAPNGLVRFHNPGAAFTIGRVTVSSGTDAVSGINEKNTSKKWTAIVGDSSFNSDGTIIVGIAQHCWIVDVDAANGHAEEEALWHVNIAVSLLRLTASAMLGPYLPRLGSVEPHPFYGQLQEINGIILDNASISTGSSNLAPFYVINCDTRMFCGCDAFKEISNLISNPTKGTVAARVSQGLGWLTRGRQAHDRAERFLFFFTAIEALLSLDDKTAPVVQTIARTAACMLNDNVKKRVELVSKIKKLYAIRSALVHAGTRSVSSNDANTIQYIAECLFQQVLNKVNITEKLENFHKKLDECSYGLPWSEDLQDRFSTIAKEILPHESKNKDTDGIKTEDVPPS